MINLSFLVAARDYYITRGYTEVEVPWLVDLYVDKITNDYTAYIINNNPSKTLVGSGEQGFLQLIVNKQLQPGVYQTTTPCFRNDVVDYLHQEYFIKSELIITNKVNLNSLDRIVSDAYGFFRKYLNNINVRSTTTMSYDIESNGIELGSYGIRKYKQFDWVYGTGCALPRLNKVIEKYE